MSSEETFFQLHMDGSARAKWARVRLRAVHGDAEVDVSSSPAVGAPVSIWTRTHQKAAARLVALGFSPDEDGITFVVRGDAAVRFWMEGVAKLPNDWDLSVPSARHRTK